MAWAMVASTAEAAPDRVGVTSATIARGDTGNVAIVAVDLTAPGVAAWQIDVTWDEAVVDAVSCSSSVSQCSTEFASDTGRITGASEDGLSEDTVLATFTFACGMDEGTSPLSLTVNVWANTSGAEPELSVVDSTITCSEPSGETPSPDATATPAALSLPSTGSGPSSGGSTWLWLAAILSATGASLLGIWALRRERV